MELEKLTLQQLMLLWGSLDAERERVEALIQEQVLQLKVTQNVGDVRATFGKGKGSYDYEAIVKAMEPDHKASVGTYIMAHTATIISVGWRAVVADLEISLSIGGKQELYALQKEHFTPGKEQVRLSIVKPKPAKNEKKT